jgi:hypothetical protein
MRVTLPVRVSDFPPGSPWEHLNGLRHEEFTWGAILRAAMVAGYPTMDAVPSPQFARWRAAGLRLALRHVRHSLVQPPEWHRLDPSEKATVNSLLGVVVTKLLVERLLNAPLFFFIDAHFRIHYPAGAPRIRPDFVAMTLAREWFAAEAKGRSYFRRTTLQAGKDQAQAIGTVNGRRVRTGIVCLTSFRRRQLEVRFSDPEPRKAKLLSAKVHSTDILEHYYNGVLRFRQFAKPLASSDIPGTALTARLWRSDDLDVRFGIVTGLEDALESRSARRALNVLRGINDSTDLKQNQFLGPDGLVVIPGGSWGGES